MSQPQLPDSSRKIVPPSAGSNLPRRRCSAPVKAPFSCPNSSEAIGGGGIAAQFTRMNRPGRAARALVNGASDQLLARPGLTQDEDSGICCATLATWVLIFCGCAGEEPTISSNIEEWSKS